MTTIEGKLLPMLYVRDVARSVEFYRDELGFDCKGFVAVFGRKDDA